MTEHDERTAESDWRHHSEVWLEVLGAVDYLADHHRPGITVWDAVEEAGRWWIADRLNPPEDHDTPLTTELPWNDPDPLRSVLEDLLSSAPPIGLPGGVSIAEVFSASLRVWLSYMSNTFNDGAAFVQSKSLAGWPGVRVIGLS